MGKLYGIASGTRNKRVLLTRMHVRNCILCVCVSVENGIYAHQIPKTLVRLANIYIYSKVIGVHNLCKSFSLCFVGNKRICCTIFIACKSLDIRS